MFTWKEPTIKCFCVDLANKKVSLPIDEVFPNNTNFEIFEP